jgi:hypothetical protein
MKSKQILVLVLVFLVLVAVVVAIKRIKSGPRTEIREDTLIKAFEPGQAGFVQFYHGAKPAEKVTLEKKDENWTVPGKYGARADTKRIDNLLGDLRGLKGEVRARKPSLFGDFAITDEQAVHLIVRDTGGSELAHLLIGKAGPDWRSSFVRKAGEDAVYLVNVPLLSRIGVSRPKEGPLAGFEEARWLDLTILPGTDAGKITALHLLSPRRELSFERAADGSGMVKEKSGESGKEGLWKLTTPGVDYPVKERGIDSLLRGLMNRRADNVADPVKEKEYGFEEPKYAATLTFEDKSIKKILIGKEIEEDGEKKFYLKVEDGSLPYTVDKYVVERLFEDAKKLLELKVLNLPEKDVEAVTLDAPEKKIVIARGEVEKGRWRVVEPELGFKEHKGAAKRLAQKFLTFEPDDLLNRAGASELGEPEYSTVIDLTAGGTRWIDIFGEIEGTDGYRYVRVDGVETVFSVARHTLNQLFPSLVSLLKVTLADLDREALQTVEVERDGQKFTLRENPDEEDKWLLEVYGYTFNADKQKVEEIINYFTNLRPGEVLGKVDFGEYGLDKPAVSVTLTDDRQTATIIVSEKKDKDKTRYYAADAESGVVFTIVDKAVEAAKVKLTHLAAAGLRIFPLELEPEAIVIRGSVGEYKAHLILGLQEREKGTKKEKVWIMPGDREVDIQLVRKLISSIKLRLLATDITGDMGKTLGAASYKHANDCISLRINQQTLILYLYDRDEKEKMRYCVLDGRKGVLAVRQSLLEPIFKLAAKIAESPKVKKP